MKVIINSAAVHHCATNWTWDANQLVDLDFWLVFGGAGTMTVNGKQHDVTGGDCFIYKPGEAARGRHDPSNPLRVVVIHFDVDGTADVFRAWPTHRKVADLPFAHGLANRVVEAFIDDNLDVASDWFRALLREVSKTDDVIAERGTAYRHQAFISAVRDEITADPSRGWTVRRLAKQAGLGPDHFTRLFRRFTGVSPRKHISRSRMEFAKNLLLSSNHSISEIADKTGFTDVYAFSGQFKKTVGVSPLRYRRGQRLTRS